MSLGNSKNRIAAYAAYDSRLDQLNDLSWECVVVDVCLKNCLPASVCFSSNLRISRREKFQDDFVDNF